MKPENFIDAISKVSLPNVFNPYSDVCNLCDAKNSAKIRRTNLFGYISAVKENGTDSIWFGRDLGYRGGRRTGIALTDEAHLQSLNSTYPGSFAKKATIDDVVAERTAAEVWKILRQLPSPPMLWNAFPFHPHEEDNELSNRCHTKKELEIGFEFAKELIQWLKPRKVIAIGNDAYNVLVRYGLKPSYVRHPSYGGQAEFLTGMMDLYRLKRGSLERQLPVFT